MTFGTPTLTIPRYPMPSNTRQSTTFFERLDVWYRAFGGSAAKALGLVSGECRQGGMKTNSRARGRATAVGSVRRPSPGRPATGEVRRKGPLIEVHASGRPRPKAD